MTIPAVLKGFPCQDVAVGLRRGLLMPRDGVPSAGLTDVVIAARIRSYHLLLTFACTPPDAKSLPLAFPPAGPYPPAHTARSSGSIRLWLS